ncbi:hypothetical protein EVAR_69338_1 [Eumeta japonica]|uniref:Uncharacterized protein n=1 Tax=Eumeta variegata TaxID=151549 RepID=A0A4C1SNM2_EUMVA|nr:hypothetical protein EVAR_69338_1 [Eumeta japonica]
MFQPASVLSRSRMLGESRLVGISGQTALVPVRCRLCAAAVSLLLGRIGRWSGREIARSALSLARSAQAERDNESCFFVRAAGVHRFIRRYTS